ncbi:unnamed protein product [Bursaphelenchus okinawaensis]|uniref:Uncharacterized protein n=1 Tax=Bursaphelenchus okinawaensis TaxID=465554 RepID=A0A811JRC6_9BILA|nr:unnamed protein product [Bursaphelenchus okinawaensis]CAG9079277.1 unnamed protein product [Bursaphelenchus okinawaensis]
MSPSTKSKKEFHVMTDYSNPLLYIVRFVSETVRWVFFVIYSFLRGIAKFIIPNSLLPKKNLNGKIILLTGAGGVLNDQTAQICQKLGAKVYCQNIDVTDKKAVYRAADLLRHDFGEPDILINNAGLLNPVPFLECDDDKMSKLIDVNTKALFWVTKAFLPKMIERGSGHIVTLSSIAGILGAPLLVDYSASKFAAFGFMESLHLQLELMKAPRIPFTTICPYYVTTPMIDDLSITDKRFDLLKSGYVAKKVVEAIRLEQRVCIVPNQMAIFYSFRSLLPWNIGEAITLGKRVY